MEKLINYNRNLMSKGKRSHKKIQRFGKYKSFGERMMAEGLALTKYLKRVGQYKPKIVLKDIPGNHF